jgi:peptidoglycan/LPS O-acetylase OafA/YrhL
VQPATNRNTSSDGGSLPDRAPDHLPSLDGLRGVAVLLVLLTHLSLATALPSLESFKNAIRAGYLGVDIFFVLSGFLVTRLLCHDRASGRTLGRFLWRRSLRIFPAYYLLLAILAVVAPGSYIWACLFYVSNFVDAAAPDVAHPMRHAWSLAIEEQFYLVWPLVFFAVGGVGTARSRWAAWVGMPAIALASLALLAFASTQGHDLGDWTYRLPTTRLLSLSLGCSIAFAEPWLRAKPRRLVIGTILALCLGAAGLALGARYRLNGAIATIGFSGISLSAVLIALTLDATRSTLRVVLANAPLQAVGRISYGLYLYHFPIFVAMGVRYADDAPSLGRIALATTIAFAVAAISFVVYERPILAARDRIPTPAKLWRRWRGRT